MGTPALIGLGSNLGDRKAHLDAAVAALATTPGLEVRAVSSYRETTPVGGPPGQGAFLNAAASIETTHEAHALLRALQTIEDREGRVRSARWGERTLDLDLLLFGDRMIDTPKLRVPHPRMGIRRFVLAPLAEIAPEAVDPLTRRTTAELLDNLDRRPSHLALPGWWAHPSRSATFRRIVHELSAEGLSDRVEARPWSGRVAPLDEDPDQGLDRRFHLLRSDRWSSLGDRWLVSDFWLGDAAYLASDWLGNDLPRWESYIDRMIEIKEQVIAPTFMVFLRSGVMSWLGIAQRAPVGEPALWIDSEDPDVIVEEILSACTASRSG